MLQMERGLFCILVAMHYAVIIIDDWLAMTIICCFNLLEVYAISN